MACSTDYEVAKFSRAIQFATQAMFSIVAG